MVNEWLTSSLNPVPSHCYRQPDSNWMFVRESHSLPVRFIHKRSSRLTLSQVNIEPRSLPSRLLIPRQKSRSVMGRLQSRPRGIPSLYTFSCFLHGKHPLSTGKLINPPLGCCMPLARVAPLQAELLLIRSDHSCPGGQGPTNPSGFIGSTHNGSLHSRLCIDATVHSPVVSCLLTVVHYATLHLT